jgi:hypothetical protein
MPIRCALVVLALYLLVVETPWDSTTGVAPDTWRRMTEQAKVQLGNLWDIDIDDFPETREGMQRA